MSSVLEENFNCADEENNYFLIWLLTFCLLHKYMYTFWENKWNISATFKIKFRLWSGKCIFSKYL